MSIRRRIADSAWLNRSVEAVLAAWISIAYKTSKWDRTGFEEMENAVRQNEPVIVVLWHQRLMMAPFLFDPKLGPICTFTSTGRAGQLAGRVVERFGLGTISMSSHKRHIALTREVMGKIRQGVSIGITADGPRGPARVASDVPLLWARASQKRVFLVSFSARRVHALPTWDQMWVPALWTRGVFRCQEWTVSIPRSIDETEAETLRANLQSALDAVTDETDRATGRLCSAE
ncbi:lysophospholipid acyltransferase family protein [Falsiphaeobacter marinintestinus]|uniref:lysophospholipid acyltransferase family protein n=1 Tax=Falsiphaeobacter marinintestinus TaxID=1492905 RepID=UPI0011B5F6CC|nr:DUF374 domain-containing protein [Phaeobacter marinintestinus]